MVRNKFVLSEFTEYPYGGRKLIFTTQYDQSIIDQSFAKATPSGKFEILCDNPKALEQMHVGKTYYIDVTEVGDEPK